MEIHEQEAERVILVVDDSPLAPCAVRDALVPHGYTVERAFDEHDALEKLAREPAISLVLVDMRTPCTSGLEVVRALEHGEIDSSVPVVILSAEGQPHLMEKARNAGVRAWLVKPFDPNLFVTAVHGYIEQPQSQNSILSPAPTD